MRSRRFALGLCLFMCVGASAKSDEPTLAPPLLTLQPQQSAPTPPPANAAGGDAEELAKKLSNPIASLISIPFQFNYDAQPPSASEALGPKSNCFDRRRRRPSAH